MHFLRCAFVSVNFHICSPTFDVGPQFQSAVFQSAVDWSKEANEHFKRIGHALDKGETKFTVSAARRIPAGNVWKDLLGE